MPGERTLACGTPTPEELDGPPPHRPAICMGLVVITYRACARGQRKAWGAKCFRHSLDIDPTR